MTKTKSNSSHELAVDSIYTALLQLMQKKPYAEITITDIVERAGVSRMAYYRNYSSKDDILLRRLEAELNHFYEIVLKDKKTSGSSSSALEYLTSFFDQLQKDQALQAVIQAGMLEQMLELHKSFMYNIYRYVLDIDMDSEENIQKMYQDMGGITGLILYCRDCDYQADSRKLAEMILH